MNKDVLTIVKKEFHRFFGDKRLLFTTVFMPGLLIFVMYTFMGKGLATTLGTSVDQVYKVYTVNMPDGMTDVFNGTNIEFENIDAASLDTNKEKIREDELDAIVVFPDNFNEKVAAYDIASGESAPNIGIYYSSADNESQAAYSIISAVFDAYETQIANKFDVNAGEGYDQATAKDTTGMIFSMMMPMLLLIFLYSGCMAVAPDSIAGEKERGTIATLLVTPIKRSSLAWGKIISLSIFSLLAGLSSFIGTMASMPALMGGESVDGLNASVYGAKEYILLLAIILSTVLLFVSVLAVISAFAKSVKEAGTLILPFMLIIMATAIGSMMGSKKDMAVIDAVIPIYGTAKSIGGIFAFNYNVSYVLLAVAINIVVAVIMTLTLTKMFSNEKVMFSN